MNAVALLISAVSVFAVSANPLAGEGLLHVDFKGLPVGLGAHGTLVKGLHFGAHVAHFLVKDDVKVHGFKCGPHFAWAAPSGALVKEVLAFSHCKAGHHFHFAHVTLVGGAVHFLHFPAAGFPLPLEHHLWFAKLAKGFCGHAKGLVGLPHHAVLADLAHVLG